MAFYIFPAELWEAILDKLNDSQDVLNAFQAYPEFVMEGILRTKRHLWLFDQVFSFVFTELNPTEILACRQVCKQWSQAVDNFVENHPSKRAFNQEENITGQRWIPTGSMDHYHLQSYLGGLKLFNKGETFARFLKDMAHHPPGKNPFFGRSIWISERGTRTQDLEQFWNSGMEFLRKFGEHIWFIKVSFKRKGNTIELHNILDEALRQVPNLKGLKIESGYASAEAKNGIDQLKYSQMKPFALLPRLESVEIKLWGLPQNLVDFILKCYSPQVRRVILNAQYWRAEYSNLFPELVEFRLPGSYSAKGLTDIISTLQSPKLYKLEVQLPWQHCEETMIIQNIARLLTKFPQMNSLVFFPQSSCYEMGAVRTVERVESLSNSTTPISSLKSMTLCGATPSWGHFKNFLVGNFPALEYLEIMFNKELKHVDMEMYDCNSDLWKLLPKLREINIIGRDPRNKIHFVRLGC